jgi:hypothetical protein
MTTTFWFDVYIVSRRSRTKILLTTMFYEYFLKANRTGRPLIPGTTGSHSAQNQYRSYSFARRAARPLTLCLHEISTYGQFRLEQR